MDSVISVRKHEREINRKGKVINPKNRLQRMVRDDEGFAEDEIPRKKARHQRYARDYIMDNR